MFLSVNAGKRSLAVSLADERGREIVLRLADGADVFLQSLRPGLAERMGLGAGRDPSAQPAARLLLASAHTGTSGPLSHEPGYDALMQAAGGLISMTGEPGRPGVRVGSSLIDMGTGMWSALGIVAALLEREKTGEGTSSTRPCTRPRSATSDITSSGTSPTAPFRQVREPSFPMVAPYQVFPTRDGELMIAGGNDRLFSLLCEVVGMSELVADARFLTNPDRVRNREELVTLLSARLRERDTAEWQDRLTAAGVPAAPVADVADVVSAPQTTALEMIQAVASPSDPRAPPAGATALVRRRASPASVVSTAGRRAHRRGARGAGLLGGRDRVARDGRRHPSRRSRISI